MKEKNNEAPITGYTKQQFLSSKQFISQRDVLNGLLEDDKLYTQDQVKKMIDDFLKRTVK